MRRGTVLAFQIVFTLAALRGIADADPIDYSYLLDTALFGFLNQRDLGNSCGDLAGFGCGPTAAVNSFFFLQNQCPDVYGHKLIPEVSEDLNSDGRIDAYDGLIAAARTLATDKYMNTCCNKTTFRNDFFFGKQKYIEDRVPGRTTYQVYDDPALNTLDPNGNFPPDHLPPGYVAAPPSPQFLSKELRDHEDIEVLLRWFDNGDHGHYVTIVGLDWTDKDMNGVISPDDGPANIVLVDPDGGILKTRALFQRDNGSLYLINAAGLEFDLSFAVSESPIVPEPASWTLVATGLISFLIQRQRQRVVQ